MNIETKAIQKTKLNDVLQGFLDSSPTPCGNWKKYWVMKQMRVLGKNKLPRGFQPCSGQLSVQYVAA